MAQFAFPKRTFIETGNLKKPPEKSQSSNLQDLKEVKRKLTPKNRQEIKLFPSTSLPLNSFSEKILSL